MFTYLLNREDNRFFWGVTVTLEHMAMARMVLLRQLSVKAVHIHYFDIKPSVTYAAYIWQLFLE